MKDLCVWLVSFVMMIFALRYAYQIWRHDVNPTLSTWIMFLMGTGLSLATYFIAEKRDFRSGILNIMDIAAVVIVLIAILLWGEHDARFEPFEKWYLGGAAVIITYGFISGDAWRSNMLTQLLIGAGYVPTAQKLLIEKRNTESFTTWSLGIIAGIFALYPAIVEDNLLAVLYAVRTIVLVAIIIAIMAYYEIRSKKTSS